MSQQARLGIRDAGQSEPLVFCIFGAVLVEDRNLSFSIRGIETVTFSESLHCSDFPFSKEV
ncbi:hypothetical protein B7486_10075 [cyanobacterium TDX16]|nr:hypothetical protein B7486_10075 [cyanobacterium TDX16]